MDRKVSARDAVDEFARDHYVDVVRAVAVFCGDVGVAEDAVQDALVKAWGLIARGDDIRSLRPWVATTAINRTRSRFRSLRRERLSASPANAQATTAAPIDVDLLRAIAALPPRQRSSVALVYLLDLSVVDAAQEMGVAEGTVKNALFRARASLAVALGERRLGAESKGVANDVR